MEVSFFKGGITDTTPTKHAPIIKILEAIKGGFWKQKIETLRACKDEESQEVLKMALPYFTASGTFKRRQDKDLLEHSGLIQIDFDSLDDNDYRNYMFSALSKDRFVFACFDSPRGKGLKVIVKIEPNPSKHLASFWSLYGYFYGKYALRADSKVFAISMPFYISYDPELYLNENSELWTLK